jgi:hypothetical protein
MMARNGENVQRTCLNMCSSIGGQCVAGWSWYSGGRWSWLAWSGPQVKLNWRLPMHEYEVNLPWTPMHMDGMIIIFFKSTFCSFWKIWKIILRVDNDSFYQCVKDHCEVFLCFGLCENNKFLDMILWTMQNLKTFRFFRIFYFCVGGNRNYFTLRFCRTIEYICQHLGFFIEFFKTLKHWFQFFWKGLHGTVLRSDCLGQSSPSHFWLRESPKQSSRRRHNYFDRLEKLSPSEHELKSVRPATHYLHLMCWRCRGASADPVIYVLCPFSVLCFLVHGIFFDKGLSLLKKQLHPASA